MSNSRQKAILWLRNDLRLHDHEGWQMALLYKELLPVFIWNRALDAELAQGFTRCGPGRKTWILQTVKSLKQKLQKKGSDLHYLNGKPEEEIVKLFRETQADVVIIGHEAAWEEQQQVQHLKAAGIPIKVWYGNTLIHPEDLPFSKLEVPEMFTQFRKKAESRGDHMCRELFEEPEKLPPYFENRIANELPLVSEMAGPFGLKPGEEEAMNRIASYIWDKRYVHTYKETRNGLLGLNYSGKWSIWLSCGALSPRYLYHQIKLFERKHGANESTYWVIFELLWRDYFKWISEKHGAALFSKNGIRGEKANWEMDNRNFGRWSEGKTRQPFCDANMKELTHTGFMSNRGRQNVASYWCHNLKGDWRLGAQWFEHHLIDYDPDSNYGNWLYVAGLGNDPRENRVFNLERQASMYDPNGAYVAKWLAK